MAFKVIGEDVFFEGYRVGSLGRVPATLREQAVHELEVADLESKAYRKGYGQGWDDRDAGRPYQWDA